MGETEQLSRVNVVSGEVMDCVFAAVHMSCNRNELHSSGHGIDRGINKKNGIGIGYIFREIGRPLLASENANAGVVAESMRGPLGKPRPDAIVAAQRVATGENQAVGFFKVHRLRELGIQFVSFMVVMRLAKGLP